MILVAMFAFSLWKVRGYLLLSIFLTLFIVGGLGVLADYLLGTSPKGLIVGVVLSFPLSNIFAIRFAKAKMAHT